MIVWCTSCKKDVDVHTYQDGDGDGMYTRTWTVAECAQCGCEELLAHEDGPEITIDDIHDSINENITESQLDR